MNEDLFLQRLESVAKDLAWLDADVMFFGAGVLALFVDHKFVSAEGLRPTDDVDALIDLPGAELKPVHILVNAVEAALRDHSWRLDMRSHRRNQYAYLSPHGIAVDFVFDELCSPSDWVLVAQKAANLFELPSGRVIRIPTPALLLVSKAAASRSEQRWEAALQSHDIEDIALLMAGCTALERSFCSAPEPARDYLCSWADELLRSESDYGQRAYACLEGNWPRAVEIEEMDRLLEVMVGLEAGGGQQGSKADSPSG